MSDTISETPDFVPIYFSYFFFYFSGEPVGCFADDFKITYDCVNSSLAQDSRPVPDCRYFYDIPRIFYAWVRVFQNHPGLIINWYVKMRTSREK